MASAAPGSAARALWRLLELCGERCGGGRLEGGVVAAGKVEGHMVEHMEEHR